MKRYIILFLFGLLMFVLTFLVSLNFFDKTNEEFVSQELEKARAFREISEGNSVKETSFEEEKIGINTKLNIRKVYSKCNHIIEINSQVDTDMVNLNKEQFQRKYPNFIIKEFSKDEVDVEENIDGYCDDHFKISLGEDFVEVFKLNSRGEEELYFVTNICRDYLAQKDILNLKKGIEIYGKENINSKLEDYE